MIPPAPPIIGAFAHSSANTGKEGKLPPEASASICLGRLVFFIFIARNVQQAGEVSGSDVTRSCVSSCVYPCRPVPSMHLSSLQQYCMKRLCLTGVETHKSHAYCLVAGNVQRLYLQIKLFLPLKCLRH